MANRLIKASYELSALDKKSILYKIRVRGIINNLRRSFAKLADKDEYNARDIINLALLVDTAHTMKLCDIDIEGISVIAYKGYRKIPTIGVVEIDTSNKFKYKASLESDIDMIGSIHMEWIVEGKIISPDFENVSKNINTTVEVLKDIKNPSTPTETLLKASFALLANVFYVYTEEILDNLKWRYRK